MLCLLLVGVQIFELEQSLQAHKNDSSSSGGAGGGGRGEKRDPAEWIPKVPAKYTLTGHRATINCVVFHPKFKWVIEYDDGW